MYRHCALQKGPAASLAHWLPCKAPAGKNTLPHCFRVLEALQQRFAAPVIRAAQMASAASSGPKPEPGDSQPLKRPRGSGAPLFANVTPVARSTKVNTVKGVAGPTKMRACPCLDRRFAKFGWLVTHEHFPQPSELPKKSLKANSIKVTFGRRERPLPVFPATCYVLRRALSCRFQFLFGSCSLL